MKQAELKAAYPALTQDCHDEIVRTARRVSTETAQPPERNAKLRQPFRRGMVIALLILLVLMSVAYAALKLGIVDYLLHGHHQPSEEMIASAQALHVREKQDNIKVTVTGAMYDGDKLSLSFLLENLKPEELAQLNIKRLTLGGELVEPDFSSLWECWLPSTFGMQLITWSRNPVSGGMITDPIQATFAGQQEVVMVLSISRPTQPLVVVDGELLEPLESIADIETREEKQALLDCMKSSGLLIADEAHLDASWWQAQGYGVLDRTGEFYPLYVEDSITGEMVEQWEYERPMEESAELVLRFMIDADRGLEYRKEYGFRDTADSMDGRISLPDCTVRLQRLTVTPLSTNLVFQILPLENTKEAVEMLYETYGMIELSDENGRELDFADMEYSYGDRNYYQDQEGQWLVEWDWTMAGVKAYPDEIHIAARADWDEGVPPNERQKEAFAAFAEKMVFVKTEKE